MAIPAALRRDLADIPLLEDAGSLRMRSRDFFWFSPILKEMLDDKRAEIVAVPRNKSDVVRVAAACARHRVPLTVRGGGTGNYGQAVPLAGGVVLDMAQARPGDLAAAGHRALLRRRSHARYRPCACACGA